MTLGLDLQGGIHMVLELDLVDLMINLVNDEYKNDFKELKSYESILKNIHSESTNITFIDNIFDRYDNQTLINFYSDFIPQSIDTNQESEYLKMILKEKLTTKLLSSTEIIRNRIDAMGVTEPVIQTKGNNQIVIEIAGIQDTSRAESLIKNTGKLEFKLVKDNYKTWSKKLNKLTGFSEISKYIYIFNGNTMLEFNAAPSSVILPYTFVQNEFVNDVSKIFTNNDNVGRYGIEGYFNNILSGHNAIVEYNKTATGKTKLNENISKLAKNGSDVELTIDIKIQEILQNELKNALITNKAKSANGIIINPNSGEILAIASLPDFDLNKFYDLPTDSAEKYYLNRPISSAYEPGSTFKIICFADALENNIDKIKNTYFCENGFYKGRYIDPFKDHDEGYDSLTFDEIFSNSSNIGTVKIFQDLEQKSSSNIKFFGWVNYKDLPELYSKCDAGIVLYEQKRHEKVKLSSLKTMEYIASGLPVFSTNVPGQEFIAQRGYGVTANEFSFKQFEAFILALPKYRKIIASDLQKIKNEWSWKRAARETVEALEQIRKRKIKK